MFQKNIFYFFSLLSTHLHPAWHPACWRSIRWPFPEQRYFHQIGAFRKIMLKLVYTLWSLKCVIKPKCLKEEKYCFCFMIYRMCKSSKRVILKWYCNWYVPSRFVLNQVNTPEEGNKDEKKADDNDANAATLQVQIIFIFKIIKW